MRSYYREVLQRRRSCGRPFCSSAIRNGAQWAVASVLVLRFLSKLTVSARNHLLQHIRTDRQHDRYHCRRIAGRPELIGARDRLSWAAVHLVYGTLVAYSGYTSQKFSLTSEATTHVRTHGFHISNWLHGISALHNLDFVWWILQNSITV